MKTASQDLKQEQALDVIEKFETEKIGKGHPEELHNILESLKEKYFL